MLRSFALAAVAAVSLTAIAQPADAALIVTFTPTEGGFTATFGNNAVPLGSFDDSTTIFLEGGILNGTFSTRADNRGGVTVTGAGRGVSFAGLDFVLTPGVSSTFGELEDTLIAPGNYTLRIRGTNTGGLSSYSGTLNFLAVPEPATWALMLGGFGLIGVATRRRVKPKVSFA